MVEEKRSRRSTNHTEQTAPPTPNDHTAPVNGAPLASAAQPTDPLARAILATAEHWRELGLTFELPPPSRPFTPEERAELEAHLQRIEEAVARLDRLQGRS